VLLQGLHRPLALSMAAAGGNASASLLDGAGLPVWTSQVEGLPVHAPAQATFLEVRAAPGSCFPSVTVGPGCVLDANSRWMLTGYRSERCVPRTCCQARAQARPAEQRHVSSAWLVVRHRAFRSGAVF
jgi:hypothetical protein